MPKMKVLRIYFPVILLLSVVSCKKLVEDQKEKAAMSFITDGRWKVQSYLVDTVPITQEFEGYEFKFNDNGTVDGIKGAAAEAGTWVADIRDYSITSEFSGAAEPLQKLNGKWIIKDSGETYVKADLSADSTIIHLHLVKLP